VPELLDALAQAAGQVLDADAAAQEDVVDAAPTGGDSAAAAKLRRDYASLPQYAEMPVLTERCAASGIDEKQRRRAVRSADRESVREAFPFLCGPFCLRFTYAAPVLVKKFRMDTPRGRTQ
jgi:hypothetical protein